MSATICPSPNAPDPKYMHAHTTIASKIALIRRQSFPNCSHETHTLCDIHLCTQLSGQWGRLRLRVCNGRDGFNTKESDGERADSAWVGESRFLKYDFK